MTAAARRVTGSKPISLQTIARQMFDESHGDLAKATEKMVNYVTNLPRLSDELLRIGARTLINSIPIVDRKACAAERGETASTFAQAVPFRMNEATKKAQARIRGLGAASRNAILNDLYTIGSICKPLREWLGTEIAEHGQRQLLAGQTAVRNANFLIAVGEAAGDEKIGDKLDEATVTAMKAKAYEMA